MFEGATSFSQDLRQWGYKSICPISSCTCVIDGCGTDAVCCSLVGRPLTDFEFQGALETLKYYHRKGRPLSAAFLAQYGPVEDWDVSQVLVARPATCVLRHPCRFWSDEVVFRSVTIVWRLV